MNSRRNFLKTLVAAPAVPIIAPIIAKASTLSLGIPQLSGLGTSPSLFSDPNAAARYKALMANFEFTPFVPPGKRIGDTIRLRMPARFTDSIRPT